MYSHGTYTRSEWLVGSQNVHSLAPCLTSMLKQIMLPDPSNLDSASKSAFKSVSAIYLVLYKPLGRTSLRHKTKKPQTIIGFPDGAVFVEFPVTQSPGS